MAKPWIGVRMTVDQLPNLWIALRMLAERRVLAGIPADRVRRKDGAITNAAIGYIQENGDPAGRIPPRPFLVPAVAAMKDQIAKDLAMAGRMALSGNPGGVDRVLNALGLRAQNAIRAKINEGIPPPLAASTLRGRILARTAIKGAKAELARRAAGGAEGTDLAKPLIATGQLRNSITYVIRNIGYFRAPKMGTDIPRNDDWLKWNAKWGGKP